MSKYDILCSKVFWMGHGSLKAKNDRTARLLGLLRSDDWWTTLALAKHLDISHRTLMRDLNDLKEAGYPIESDRGRGGGVRLNGRWGLERLQLTSQEAVSLLLNLSVVEALTPTSNHFGAKALKQKIASAFPESQRKAIIDLRKRILIGKTASPQVLGTFKKSSDLIWEQVLVSFFESKKIKFEYLDEKGNKTKREFDPHFLLLNWPVWYFLGWDYLRDEVRIFRIDRIREIEIQNVFIVRRPRALFLEAYETFFQSL